MARSRSWRPRAVCEIDGSSRFAGLDGMGHTGVGLDRRSTPAAMAQTLHSRRHVVGRCWIVGVALGLAGCNLNPHGELPSGDPGPANVSDTPTPPFELPAGDPGRPGFDPALPPFPMGGESDETVPLPPAVTPDIPPTPDLPLADDDAQPTEEGPILPSDAGASAPQFDAGVSVSDGGAPGGGGAGPGSADAGAFVPDDNASDEIDISDDLSPIASDAGAGDAGAPTEGGASADAASDGGLEQDAGTDAGSPDASAVDGGRTDAGQVGGGGPDAG
jgi:hypothetical protein